MSIRSARRRFFAPALAIVSSLTALSCGDGGTGPAEANTPKPTSIQVSGAPATLLVGDTVTLSATVRDQNNQVMTGQSVTWTSTNPASLTVDAAGGVTAVGAGTGEIRASLGSLSGQASISVTLRPVGSIEIADPPAELELRDTLTLHAILRDDRGNEVDGRDIEWSSSDPTVLSVTAGGLVSALAAGSAQLVATLDERSDTADVVVHPWAIADETLVVDSTVMTLVSDSAQRARGDLRFDVLGGVTPPEVQPGDILVGAQDGGFLRRVETVSVTGTRIETTTSDASLSDVIQDGSFSASVSLSGSPAPSVGGDPVPEVRWGSPVVTYVAPGVELATGPHPAAGSWVLGADLCEAFKDSSTCPTGVSVDLSNAQLDFDPAIDIWANWEEGELESAGAEFSGDLSLVGDLGVVVKSAWGLQAEGTIVKVVRPVYFAIGPVPVAFLISTELKHKIEFQVEGAVDFKLKASGNASVEAGGEYEPSAASPTSVTADVEVIASADPPQVSGKIGVSEKYTITPSIEVLLYGVSGPALEAGPFFEAKLEAAGGPEQNSCDLSAAFGLEGKFIFHLVKIGGKNEAPRYEKPLGPLEYRDQWNCPFGAVQASVNTVGSDPDPDGYTVAIVTQIKPVGVNGSVTIDGLSPGTHSVTLGNVDNQCSVDQNPKAVTVFEGQTTPVSFSVECGETTGTLQVETVTEGSPAGNGGYTVTVDGTQTQPISPTGSITFEGMAAGSHTVQLEEVPGNCTVNSSNPQDANVEASGTATVQFAVTCHSNDLTIRTETTGQQLDSNGYTVVVDNVLLQGIGVNGVAVFGELEPGNHSVKLVGVAANCAVSGPNPRTVQLESGGTEVLFQVTCLAGTLVVEVSTEGEPGVSTYLTSVDGSTSRSVPINGSTLFADLQAGPHSVELSGVPGACVVLGENPQTVEVPGSVAFSVNCNLQEEGSRIAVLRYASGNSEIWTTNEDGLDPRKVLGPVTGTIREFSFSRDGSQIAYHVTVPGASDPQQLWAANADGTNHRKLLSNNYLVGFNDGWSPDGTEVAVLWAESSSEPKGIYRVKVDGSGMSVIPNTSSALSGGSLDAPAWSPGGSQFVFTCQASDVDPSPSPYNTGICAIQTDGTGLRVVARNAREPVGLSWSPDGSKVAYYTTDYQDAAGGLWILRADTWTSSQLTFSDGRLPTWSPDGSELAFQRSLITGGVGIYVMPSAGGAALRISTSNTDFNPNWKWE
jgi:Tol biopolymer transport system component